VPRQCLTGKATASFVRGCLTPPLSRCAEAPRRILLEGPPMYLLCSGPLYFNLIPHIAVSYMYVPDGDQQNLSGLPCSEVLIRATAQRHRSLTLSLFLPSTLVFKVASHGNDMAESVWRGRRFNRTEAGAPQGDPDVALSKSLLSIDPIFQIF
jgi:hypothetical protein